MANRAPDPWGISRGATYEDIVEGYPDFSSGYTLSELLYIAGVALEFSTKEETE